MCRNAFPRMLVPWLILGIMLSIANTQESLAQQSETKQSDARQSVDAAVSDFTALVDSAMRCSLAGMHAAGIAILDQAAELGAADASVRQDVVLAGLRASMLSNLGLLAEAESRFRSIENDLKTVPYAPYGACLRAHLALHYYRMGRHEEAFNLITAAVRLKGDAEHCRAEASGFYHLGALHSWEGNHAEAREMFAMATRTIEKAPRPGAAGACYWAALAEALHASGTPIEAHDAYTRAYRHAVDDPVSRGRCAARIAMRHADLLLHMNETAKAEDMLRRAKRHADAGACPVLLGSIEEVRARLALRSGEPESAQRLLAGALWHYFRGMTDENCAQTAAECGGLRSAVRRAIDRAFTALMHDGALYPALAPAAWNTHLALREFRGVPRCVRADEAREAAHAWLQHRLANETRCLVGADGSARTDPTGPTLRLLQRVLPRASSAVVIRRFLDQRQEPPRPCYTGVLLSDAPSAVPRMIWLDAAGILEHTIIPKYVKHFSAPYELWNSTAGQAEPSVIRILPNDTDAWEYCVHPLLERLPDKGPVYLLADGVFRDISLSALYDRAGGDFLGDRMAVHVFHAVGDGSKGVPRDDFSAPILVDDAPRHLRAPLPAVPWPVSSAFADFAPAAADTDVTVEARGAAHSDTDDDAGAGLPRSDAPAGAKSASRSSIEDTAVQRMDASITEAQLRAHKLGRVHVYDIPVFFLPDTTLHVERYFLPWTPAADDPFLRAGLLMNGRSDVPDILSRSAAMCGENDGVLLADEIAAMDLRFRQCIVLPRSDFLGHGAMQSASAGALLQSVFHAGAPAVLHTLWPVPHPVRERFLRHFANEFDGLNLDEAFRAARRAVRDTWPHPYFWGAFQLTRGRVSSL